MSNKTKIEWAEQTWNPVVGCTKVSPGCKHCYAETQSKWLKGMRVSGYENDFSVIKILPQRLNQPLKRKKPTVYFVNSMSDLFHEEVPFNYVDQVMATIRQTPQHGYQVLTKRSERMREYFSSRSVPANVWLGVSVEDRKYGIPRIADLQQIEAGVRFLSVEPLLEDVGQITLEGIHWVIVGGESGHKARPMQEAWVSSIQQQCEQAGVAFFFKQWGEWGPDGIKRDKKVNGRQFQGQTWDEMPAVPIRLPN
jgi:protein gp37